MRLLHRNREESPFMTPAEVAEQRPAEEEVRRAVVWFAGGAVILISVPFRAASAAVLAGQLGIPTGFRETAPFGHHNLATSPAPPSWC
jgi:hypothetical protein